MKQINIIIIDDEESARENLRSKIKQHSKRFHIQGEAENISTAKKLIEEKQPDAIFLDISMPQGSGFDLLNEFEEIFFDVIFVTAYNRFAIEAFKHFAVGYILKPIEISELSKVLDYLARKKENDQSQNLKNIINHISNQINTPVIAIPVDSGFEFIDYTDIIYLEAEQGYTAIYMDKNKSFLSSKSLSYYKNLLDSKVFVQLHRSFVINLSHLKKYYKVGFVQMSNGKEIPVSKSKRSEFKNLFR